MALNFPDSPSVNDIYRDTASGFSYQWDGTVWKSYADANSSNIKTIDDISSGFNGSTLTFSLTSGGTSFTPASAKSLIVNLGGVIQDPTDDYSVSGSQLSFSSPPAAGLTFSAISLGPAVPINTIPDGTSTDGSLTVVGILSASQLTSTVLTNYSEKVINLGNTGATPNINLANGTYVTATLDQSATFTFTTGITTGAVGFSMLLTNGTGGPFSITWPGSVKWPNNTTPSRTTTDGKSDLWAFVSSDNGTTWYGNISIYNFS
jgi:hypothetical protein